MILLDTTELKRPTPRKLHTAWWELGGENTLATQTVAEELSRWGSNRIGEHVESHAERTLRTDGHLLNDDEFAKLAQDAWWAMEWRDPDSPYKIVLLDDDQKRLKNEILHEIDGRCFPNTEHDDIIDSGDANIIAETLVLGGNLLLTSNMRSIDRMEVDNWAVANGDRIGFKPEPVLALADATLVEWTRTHEGTQRWVEAGLLACWPNEDRTDAMEIVKLTHKSISKMIEGTGGRLVQSGGRLLNVLEGHPNPEALVERRRAELPSKTVESDRRHPSYPARPRSARDWYTEARERGRVVER